MKRYFILVIRGPCGFDSGHRLKSRDRPTKTGELCLRSPFFYVAALNVCNAHMKGIVDGEWGGTISAEENV